MTWKNGSGHTVWQEIRYQSALSHGKSEAQAEFIAKYGGEAEGHEASDYHPQNSMQETILREMWRHRGEDSMSKSQVNNMAEHLAQMTQYEAHRRSFDGNVAKEFGRAFEKHSSQFNSQQMRVMRRAQTILEKQAQAQRESPPPYEGIKVTHTTFWDRLFRRK